MKKFKYICSLVLPLVMLATGCASEDSPEIQEPTKVVFKISTRAATDPGTPGDPVENEKIKSYKIFAVDKNNQVRAIVEKTLNPAVEEDIFTADIPAGTYDFYAFANIGENDINNLEIKGNIEETNKIKDFFKLTQITPSSLPTAPTLETIKSIIWKDMPNGDFTDRNIPMSGFRTRVKVTEKIEESFSIEVVRMLAKLEFQFSAPDATVPVSIKEVTIHNVSKGDIPFMPDYGILGNSAPTLLPGVILEDLRFENLKIVLDNNSSDAKSTVTKYLRESVSSHPTGGYLVSVKMDRGPVGEGSDVDTEIRQYAIANELQYINRNDYIIIPIQITDWIIEIDVRFYPPIGGYPAVITEEKNREYYIKFGTEGYFEIVPRIRNASPGSEWLAKDKFEIAIDDDKITGNEIFEKKPSVDTKTGEIIGTLNNSTGTAVVPISITVDQNGKTETFTKNIYIIKEVITAGGNGGTNP